MSRRLLFQGLQFACRASPFQAQRILPVLQLLPRFLRAFVFFQQRGNVLFLLSVQLLAAGRDQTSKLRIYGAEQFAVFKLRVQLFLFLGKILHCAAKFRRKKGAVQIISQKQFQRTLSSGVRPSATIK